MSNEDKLFIDSTALALYLKHSIKRYFETEDLSEEQKHALLWATIFVADNAIEVANITKEDFIEMYKGENA